MGVLLLSFISPALMIYFIFWPFERNLAKGYRALRYIAIAIVFIVGFFIFLFLISGWFLYSRLEYLFKQLKRL